jgi:hypothetical protein
MKSHAAISASLPKSLFWRYFGSAVVHFLLTLVFVFNNMTRSENKMVVMSRELNDPGIFNNVVPRVYLYSKADQMVDWTEVEDHADQAASKGWSVEKVRFEKSPHVGHILEDGERYWGAVMNAWEKGEGL